MSMDSGGIHGNAGEGVPDLKPLESLTNAQEILEGLMASCDVDERARVRLHRLQTACVEGVDVTIHFEAVKSFGPPYTLDASSNKQSFIRLGNMYFLSFEGKFQQGTRSLLPVCGGEKVEAMLVWCCLAAS